MHDSIDRGSDLYTSQLSLPVWLGRKEIWFGMNMSQFYFLQFSPPYITSLHESQFSSDPSALFKTQPGIEAHFLSHQFIKAELSQGEFKGGKN